MTLLLTELEPALSGNVKGKSGEGIKCTLKINFFLQDMTEFVR